MGTAKTNDGQLSWADLETLGADLKQHFSLLFGQKMDSKLAPIAQELKALKTSVGKTATTASSAYNMMSSLEGRVSEAEATEKHLKDRLA